MQFPVEADLGPTYTSINLSLFWGKINCRRQEMYSTSQGVRGQVNKLSLIKIRRQHY